MSVLAGIVNRFPPWGDVTFVVRRCLMTGILIHWFSDLLGWLNWFPLGAIQLLQSGLNC
jgi:hypothetical protein